MSDPNEVNDRVNGELSDIAWQACIAMFKDYGVEIEKTNCEEAKTAEILYCGAMGFVGAKLRGSILLAATKMAVERSCPPNGVARDWTGELTNQLVGRVKTRLLARGIETMLATPLVLQGEHIAPVPRRKLNPGCFSCQPGVVLVWVDVECDSDFELGAPSDDLTAGAGDALFF
jgi:CheY-specific phosphatase CheX